jgi:hypothetical protein
MCRLFIMQCYMVYSIFLLMHSNWNDVKCKHFYRIFFRNHSNRISYSFFYIFIRVISLPEGLMVAFYATGMARTKTIAHNYNFQKIVDIWKLLQFCTEYGINKYYFRGTFAHIKGKLLLQKCSKKYICL